MATDANNDLQKQGKDDGLRESETAHSLRNSLGEEPIATEPHAHGLERSGEIDGLRGATEPRAPPSSPTDAVTAAEENDHTGGVFGRKRFRLNGTEPWFEREAVCHCGARQDVKALESRVLDLTKKLSEEDKTTACKQLLHALEQQERLNEAIRIDLEDRCQRVNFDRKALAKGLDIIETTNARQRAEKAALEETKARLLNEEERLHDKECELKAKEILLERREIVQDIREANLDIKEERLKKRARKLFGEQADKQHSDESNADDSDGSRKRSSTPVEVEPCSGPRRRGFIAPRKS